MKEIEEYNVKFVRFHGTKGNESMEEDEKQKFYRMVFTSIMIVAISTVLASVLNIVF